MTEACRGQGEVSAADLASLFNETFQNTHHVIVVPAAGDPEYLPAAAGQPAKIMFANNFAASVLHEVSHWCLAGPNRRQLVDYGYWYQPDGRDEQQQSLFQQVEARPQGLEWILSSACGLGFHVSADNTRTPNLDLTSFRQAVREEALRFYQNGLPQRAQTFCNRLWEVFATRQQFYQYWEGVARREILPD